MCTLIVYQTDDGGDIAGICLILQIGITNTTIQDEQMHSSSSRSKQASMEIIVMAILVVLSRSCKASGQLSAEQYAEALGKAILFYEGMRSGPLPADQRMKWRNSSGLSDGRAEGADLVGGYYDAGDNVKFGLPMAFTVTMLSWSIIEGREALEKHRELGHAVFAVRWGTDYLLKASTKPDQLWVQVGDLTDHQCWERPEDMHTSRTAYQVNPKAPGSDVAGETCAALAAGSIVFRKSDPAYSRILLSKASQLSEFANAHLGRYSDTLDSAVGPFYKSYSGYEDELLWCSAWLYKASSNPQYLNYVISNGPLFGATSTTYTALDWDNKLAGVQVLLSNVFFNTKNPGLLGYKAEADDFACSILPHNPMTQEPTTPGGLLYIMDGTNLQYVTVDSFLLLAYANYLSRANQTVSCAGTPLHPQRLRDFAKQQIDYILGLNPTGMSYMVGFGSKYPLHIHHRGSSLPSVWVHPQRIKCGEGFEYYSSSQPNPNELTGAVVGGPDHSDQYADDRNNYQQSEPTTYTNSGMVGSLALLLQLLQR